MIDNGSNDGSPERIRAERPEVELLLAGENLGYAGGNNLGIRRALADGAEYLWILNNDAEPDGTALAELVAVADASPQCGLLVSSVLDVETRSISTTAFRRGASGKIPVSCAGCDRVYHQADVLTGPSFLLRARTVEEIGLYDEEYFHYYEERDLVERARRAGWEVGLACRSRVRHGSGTSLSYRSPQSTYYLLRNCLLYHRKLSGAHPLRTALRKREQVRAALALGHSFRARDFAGAAAALMAVVDACRARTGKRDLGPRFRAERPWIGPPLGG